ncbi:RNA-binding transcriptional accessory protein [Jeotgalicoccus huakuii]|uniref:Tex family protein n=1 Tax=unclassified Jeotgalicoccus TaxID=2630462 RepID=UPI001414E728|nr:MULTISPECIES: Tex family protein [unclassified Jeotgalicoccus]MCK1975817.1 RNA-binding transcriptional accessory protein [Jeotgalicoccus huakuii]QQD84895.1 RNA-binding transcriptional accessory protein [Jeotgalicoccus sp. ATCC 8456]
MTEELIKQISQKMNINQQPIEIVLELLADKNTVPFIARYRKEATGGLDEVAIKEIETEYLYLENLNKRKDEVIRLIDEQGMLTKELREEVLKQTKQSRVEDLYRPYKQKKKTRATEAKRLGLEPLAKEILKGDTEDIQALGATYLNEEVTTADDAIQGAKDIIAEMISDNPYYRLHILKSIKATSSLVSTVRKNADDPEGVFEMYYDYTERVKNIVPHRILALNRGETLKVLSVKFSHDNEKFIEYLSGKVIKHGAKTADLITDAIEDSLKRLLLPSLEREIRSDLKEKSEKHAVDVFEENLKRLLLQPPLKGRIILGLDPAYRTGCKLAVIDETGSFLAKDVVYPHKPVNKKDEAKKKIVNLIKQYDVSLIAIGNGTASRESEEFVGSLISEENLDLSYIIVNEAGASVYSASEIARVEFPDFNVEERSAVSIARRVHDPLSELVKIDPKSIGVGQYQHDINQKFLTESLDFVVETAVNQVGVDLNTASVTLLQHVAGLTPAISKNIVLYRQENGGFKKRSELKKVARLGNKTYEQCVGFLRIFNGKEPLDMTQIHPEQYKKTYELIKILGLTIDDLGTEKIRGKLSSINVRELATTLDLGVPTLEDIIESLKAPLRDVRDQYDTPLLKSDVLSIEDLKSGMTLSGTVRNVTDFGAFVDIGVKQDGLVHISQIANRYIKHPLDVVNTGDIVEVKVMDVDVKKNRIALTMKDV